MYKDSDLSMISFVIYIYDFLNHILNDYNQYLFEMLINFCLQNIHIEPFLNIEKRFSTKMEIFEVIFNL